jgi:hypothetical protein
VTCVSRFQVSEGYLDMFMDFICIFLPSALWPWGWLSSNRNECQEYFLGRKGGWCVRLTIFTTFMCHLSLNLGASTSWNPQGLSRCVMGLLHLLFILHHSNVLFLLHHQLWYVYVKSKYFEPLCAKYIRWPLICPTFIQQVLVRILAGTPWAWWCHRAD